MSKYSDAEKKEWRERMNGLIKQVSALAPEEREAISRKSPIVTSDGHPISAYNACFLTMQTELQLTIIGGFKQWQRAGRQVSPGQKAAGYIYVPMNAGDKAREELNKGEDNSERTLRFRLVPVFDISQTKECETVAA